MTAQHEDTDELARRLGFPKDRLTPRTLARISEDPLFLHHLELCKTDPELLNVLLGPDTDSRPGTPDFGTTELLARAGAAVTRWAASGFKKVPDAVYLRRLDACRGCEHLALPMRNALYRLTGSADRKTVCGLCGCDVNRKARLATEKCPDGRWDTEE
ncbi:hypothetical protein OHA98_25240 [Streptomyces sp. NBC_00654]|uniref:hypothetical protein n=1 Tax=Streptomyces sp. NBC_00654 TaxID=2975799 RepID=UPI00225B25B6|nr:hypothetical protein [Streptomyces sp. NBC_00654]MCX4968005.1 hypothetical protein [Streptomyces sp. NBC_00654]